jgi:FkbM family methyltransferase
MFFVKTVIKALLKLFKLKISREIHETEVPIETLRHFLRLLEPQNVIEMTRIGSNNDGGYVIPKNLGDSSKLFSPGCDGIVEFERDLYKKYQIPSIVLDNISKKPNDLDAFIEFEDNWLDASTSNKTISLRDWVTSKSKSNETLILQMDIEGSEYEVLRNTPEEILNRFHTIVIEFHYFEMIKNSYLFENKVKPVFELLLKSHVPVFLNPNNCCGEIRFGKYKFPRVFELTLIRRSELLVNQDQSHPIIDSYVNVAGVPPIDIDWESLRID